LLFGLANRMRQQLASSGAEIAHLKMTLGTSGSPLLAAVSVTRSDTEPQVTHLLREPIAECALIINLRAEADPDLLKEQVLAALQSLSPVAAEVHVIDTFRPGRPNPTHRMATPDACTH